MKRKHLLLCLTLLLSFITAWNIGAKAATNSLAPMTAGAVFVSPQSDGVTARVKIINWGSEKVSYFTYTLYYMDTQVTEGPFTVDLDTPLESYDTGEFAAWLKPGSELGQTDVILSINEVNGAYNEASVGYTYITRYTIEKTPEKRVVVEDYTGLWCQYCPRGIAIMESLQRMHPDDFIGIAVHCGDALDTQSYSTMESTWGSSKPSLWVNRKEKINEYVGEDQFEIEKSNTTTMRIDVSAKWDDDQNNISVSTEVEPCIAIAEGTEYAVGYVLTADGLRNSSWGQVNNYSEWQSYENAPEELDKFKEPVDPVYGLDYNHVAIASKGVEYGIDGSLPSTMPVGETVVHNVTFDNVSQHSLIQDKSKLSVCALLINKSTGKIENAAKCAIKSSSTGITSVGRNASEAVAYYSADGSRLDAPKRGLNIIRHADGTTSKVIKR